MKKITQYSFLLLALGFIAIQFKRPERPKSSSDPQNDLIQVLQPPQEVTRLLKAACYDCHSYQTRYPWYSEVAPFSWMIADHVRHGRSEVNFSNWTQYQPNEQSELLDHSGRLVERRHMPLPSYVWLHPEARLSEKEHALLRKWLKETGETLKDG